MREEYRASAPALRPVCPSWWGWQSRPRSTVWLPASEPESDRIGQMGPRSRPSPTFPGLRKRGPGPPRTLTRSSGCGEGSTPDHSVDQDVLPSAARSLLFAVRVDWGRLLLCAGEGPSQGVGVGGLPWGQSHPPWWSRGGLHLAVTSPSPPPSAPSTATPPSAMGPTCCARTWASPPPRWTAPSGQAAAPGSGR